MSRILITVCARGGSKGIPGKNIKLINGKPLIAYTIGTAMKFAGIHNANVVLSTDDEEIVQTANNYGLSSKYRRPEELSTDTAGKLGVIRDVLEYEEHSRNCRFDFIVDLDVTSPLRTVQDIETALEMLKAHPDALNIFSVSPASRSPYFNMVEEGADGYVKVVKDIGDVLSRQSAPKVFDMNASLYIYRRDFFDKGLQKATTERSLAYVMEHVCFDLDEPIDFEIMQLLMQHNKLDFFP